MVIYMTEVDEVCYTDTDSKLQTCPGLAVRTAVRWLEQRLVFESKKEVADYPIEVLFSDVGGTAGLILGMSFATVLGLIDIAIQWVIGDGPVKFALKVILMFDPL